MSFIEQSFKDVKFFVRILRGNIFCLLSVPILRFSLSLTVMDTSGACLPSPRHSATAGHFIAQKMLEILPLSIISIQ